MKTTKLLIATNNSGKLAEYRELLAGLPVELLSLAQADIVSEVEETGSTFEENADLKATTYARMAGMLTLADDSGLEVDALNGEPGVRSARYAGPGVSDEDRLEYLLDKLRDVPTPQRWARFRCVIAIAAPEREARLCIGVCEGVITYAAMGSNGFGYDPIFLIPELGQTMAEIPLALKNRLSHRAHAAAAARAVLEHMLAEK